LGVVRRGPRRPHRVHPSGRPDRDRPAAREHALTPPRTRRDRLRAYALRGFLVLFAAWAVGQAARDATWLTGLAFYIPSPVLATLALPLAAVFAASRLPRRSLLLLALAAPPVVFVAYVENDFAAKPPGPPGEFRLLHWNVKGQLGRERVRAAAASERADLYVFTEAHSPLAVGELVVALRGVGAYRSARFGGLAVVGRGDVRDGPRLIDRPRSQAWLVGWEYAGRSLNLLVVDLPSEIDVPRNPLLREVNALIEAHRPDVVVGDFNAPRRSWGLAELPGGYAHAYHAAGGGWGYTWPRPVPVYALDHCLFGPRVVPARYRLGPHPGSDHRCQVFDFSVRE
jgi:endonuclease/exonuclease/phosphatase (EEP) superfamily protein YafD